MPMAMVIYSSMILLQYHYIANQFFKYEEYGETLLTEPRIPNIISSHCLEYLKQEPKKVTVKSLIQDAPKLAIKLSITPM